MTATLTAGGYTTLCPGRARIEEWLAGFTEGRRTDPWSKPSEARVEILRRCSDGVKQCWECARAEEGRAFRAARAVVMAGDPQCTYCGAPATCADHVIPRAQGGTHDVANLAPCCARCNLQKGGRTPEQWRTGAEFTWQVRYREARVARHGYLVEALAERIAEPIGVEPPLTIGQRDRLAHLALLLGGAR
jgi:hypothetical protein